MLLITIGASSPMYCEVPVILSNGVNAIVTDLEHQRTVPAGTNGRHHLWERVRFMYTIAYSITYIQASYCLQFFDTTRPFGAGWNINVLVALPAIWTAW
jgi:hypothetical protein